MSVKSSSATAELKRDGEMIARFFFAPDLDGNTIDVLRRRRRYR